MALVYWTADGAGKVGGVPGAMFRWIRTQGSADLIVYGGDVYNNGRPKEFAAFLEQVDHNLTNLCEVAGNHDWNSRSDSPQTGEIPSGYETFWNRFPPPASRQPIDAAKRGGARYEHFIDISGWRLIFLDTGPCKGNPWPMGDPGRVAWLKETIAGGPGRRQVVFAHHSRVSTGKHGNNPNVDTLWRTLFEPVSGAPLVALTVAGHDHNVSLYGPRSKDRPEQESVEFSRGIHVLVNGAGGQGHDAAFVGTPPDLFFDDDHFCITRLRLTEEAAVVDILSFGTNDPPTKTTPDVLKSLVIRPS